MVIQTRGRKNREYLATFPSELHCVRMHSSVADSWKDLPANFAILWRGIQLTHVQCYNVQLWKWSMTPLKLGKTKFLWLKSLWYFSFHDHGGFSSVIDTAERISGKQLWGSGLKFQRCHCHRWNSNCWIMLLCYSTWFALFAHLKMFRV
jgi:hypothetical protein